MPSVGYQEDYNAYRHYSMPSGRITEEYCRGPLADVDEECESSTTTTTTSEMPMMADGGSAGSASGLKPPRKLSNQSVVLTADTDSFVIGQRVWVGGVRPGQIAYIGETQFAPGEWAGVVLDEANGKNDGCVSGVRYFQCPARRGVFARLTRLTHSPLSGSNATSPSQTTPGGGDYHSHSSGLPTMTGSRRISPAGSMSSLASRSPGKTPQVGERVIVRSAQGSKAGVLRFLGDTAFANGTWCGVELDDPVGKNDGAVEGHRYFRCPARHGLFAPLAKVSLSPSARRPGAPHRAGSKESLLSQSMSLASAATSRGGDLLREKQHHIEQLLKERDLERTEMDQAMVLASHARKDNEKLKESIQHLQEENQKLRRQIEDDAKKAEDLQFNVLEQTICKEDLTSINEAQLALNKTNADLIRGLEQKISDQARTIEELRAKETSLSDALNSAKALVQGSGNDSETITTLRQQLEQSQMLLQVLETDKEELYKNYETNKTQQQLELDTMKQSNAKAIEDLQKKYIGEIETLNIKVAESQQKLLETLGDTQKDNEIEQLRARMRELNDKKTEEIANMQETLGKENSRLKMEFSAKQADAESLTQNLESESEKVRDLERTLSDMRAQLESKNDELSTKSSAEKNLADDLQKRIGELNATLETMKSEISEKDIAISDLQLRAQHYEDKLAYSTRQTQELQTELAARNEAIEKQYIDMKSVEDSLKEEITGYKKQIEDKLSVDQIAEVKFRSELDSLHMKIAELENDKKQIVEDLQIKLEAELTASKISYQDLEKIANDYKTQLSEKTMELTAVLSRVQELNQADEKRKVENEDLDAKLEELQTQLTDVTDKLKKTQNELTERTASQSKMELDLGDATRKLQASVEKQNEINDAKMKLENELAALRDTTLDSNSELKRLTDELRAKDKDLSALKDTLSDSKMGWENAQQQLQQDLMLKTQQWVKDREEFDEKIKQLLEKEAKLTEILETQKSELERQKSAFQKELNNTRQLLEKEKSDTENILDMNNTELTDLKAKFAMVTEEKRKLCEDFEKQLSDSKTELSTKHEEIAKLQKELQELEASNKQKFDDMDEKNKVLLEENTKKLQEIEKSRDVLKTELDATKESEKSLKIRIEEMSKNTSSTQDELLKKLNDKDAAYETLKENSAKELQTVRGTLAGLTESLKEKDTLIDGMKAELQKLNEDLLKSTNDKDSVQKDSEMKLAEITRELEEAQNIRRDLENTIATKSEDADKHAADKNSLVKANAELSETVADLKSKLDNMDAVKKLTDSTITEHAASLATLRDELKQKNEITDKLAQEKQALEDNLTAIKTTEAQLRREIAEYEQRSAEERDKNMAKLNDELREKQDTLRRQGELENRLNTEIAELKSQLDALQTKDEECRRHKTRIAELEAKLDSVKRAREFEQDEKLAMAEKSALDLKTVNMRLEQELADLKNNKMKTKKTDDVHNTQSAAAVVSVNNNTATTTTTAVTAATGAADGKSENESFLEDQVRFLNSIIADMQQKNVALQTKVETLEGNGLPDLFNKVIKRAPAPRAYCDICEVFDAHETEDCPAQDEDSAPPPTSAAGGDVRPAGRVVPPPRPYCEICEVFGHDSENCDPDETY